MKETGSEKGKGAKRERFSIKRDSTVCRFTYITKAFIPGGFDGPKKIASVSSSHGEHGNYFIKTILGDNEGIEAKNQIQTYTTLKHRGALVPERFEAIRLDNGESAVLASDLTENGKYTVIANGDEEKLRDRNLALRISQVSSTTKRKLIADLINSCEAASGIQKGDSKGPGDTRFKLSPRAFMLQVNVDDLADTKVTIGDFGSNDIIKSKLSPQALTEQNIKEAAIFFSFVTQGVFQVPSESTYAYMNQDLAHISYYAKREYEERFL